MKATKKYRRLKTIVGKVSELSKISNVKLSVLIYDSKMHKLKEIYTDPFMKFENITKLKNDTGFNSETQTHERVLKFESFDAKLRYKWEKEIQSMSEIAEKCSDNCQQLTEL